MRLQRAAGALVAQRQREQGSGGQRGKAGKEARLQRGTGRQIDQEQRAAAHLRTDLLLPGLERGKGGRDDCGPIGRAGLGELALDLGHEPRQIRPAWPECRQRVADPGESQFAEAPRNARRETGCPRNRGEVLEAAAGEHTEDGASRDGFGAEGRGRQPALGRQRAHGHTGRQLNQAVPVPAEGGAARSHRAAGQVVGRPAGRTDDEHFRGGAGVAEEGVRTREPLVRGGRDVQTHHRTFAAGRHAGPPCWRPRVSLPNRESPLILPDGGPLP